MQRVHPANKHWTNNGNTNIGDTVTKIHTVHIDIVRPQPPAKSPNNPYISPYRYILTFIDRTNRWRETQPKLDITAQNVSEAFENVWIIRFGVALPRHRYTIRK